MDEDKRSWGEVIEGKTKEVKEKEILNGYKEHSKHKDKDVCSFCGAIVKGNFCSNCGHKIENNICPSCGEIITGNYCSNCGTSKSSNSNISNEYTEDSYFGLSVLSFLFPYVGIILWLAWLDDKPQKSKACGHGVLFLLGFVVFVVFLYSIFNF